MELLLTRNKLDYMTSVTSEVSHSMNDNNKRLTLFWRNIRPGGWIDQLEILPFFFSDDGTLPKESLASNWAKTVTEAAAKSERPLDLYQRCADLMEKVGFVDVQVHESKWPIGFWPKNKRLKEAGTINYRHWCAGMDGYSMHLLTKYGEPRPWTSEEVLAHVAQLRKELGNSHHHVYHFAWVLVGYPHIRWHWLTNAVKASVCGPESLFLARRQHLYRTLWAEPAIPIQELLEALVVRNNLKSRFFWWVMAFCYLVSYSVLAKEAYN